MTPFLALPGANLLTTALAAWLAWAGVLTITIRKPRKEKP